ncbi:trypsin-1-like [Adelges cooleyi]|uniref:trypsin-1-like n=1 Tax=Adelges cooleyi TaxID=133065 RepID=UPI00217FCE68|nr:trypsin-1-like [Adelges cooleyi]
MWRQLFCLMVTVTVAAAASPENTKARLPSEDTTVQGGNLFRTKMASLAEKYKPALQYIRQIVSRLFSGHRPQPVARLNSNDTRSCPPCSCGRMGLDDRIAGGTQVEYAHKYPWMGLLLLKGDFLCGASLINDKYVLTAAHCVSSSRASDYKVQLSVHHRDTDVFEEYNVNEIIRHERFVDDGGFSNDIALFRLDTDGVKTMNGNVRPVCMPEKDNSYANSVAVSAGWGVMEFGDRYFPDVLREAQLQVLSNDECRPYFYRLINLTESMVCAGLEHQGKTTCRGDSGGPLTVANGSVHHLVGIASFGKDGCQRPPSVYTRVSEYLDWIDANTKDACPCPK